MGEWLAMLSMSLFASSNLAIARAVGRGSQDNGAFLSILITSVMALGVWLYLNAGARLPAVGDAALAWFAGAGLLTMFIGRVFVFASVQHLGAVRGSAVKRLNPMFSVMLGVLVLVLGEPMDAAMVTGMLLIFSSFGVLVRQSLRNAGAGDGAEAEASVRDCFGLLINIGYVYGPISALAFALAAAFVDSYRESIRSTFTRFDPWLVAAGVLSSLGQLSFFAAISHTTISRVALITSMETFMTILLSLALFRSRDGLSAAVLFAAGFGAAGTGFIVWH